MYVCMYVCMYVSIYNKFLAVENNAQREFKRSEASQRSRTK